MPIWSARVIWTGSWSGDLRDLQNEKRPVLHIGVSPWRGSTLLPDVLPLFTKQYSDVQVVLHEAPVPELGDLAAGSVTDFCIMHIPGDLTELTYELVMREHIFLLAHRDHPLVRGLTSTYDDPIPFPDLRQLERERIVMLPPDWRLSKLLHNTFSVHNVEPQNILVTTNNTTAINLVAENMGFAFLQESGISRTPYLDRPGLLYHRRAATDLPHGGGLQEKWDSCHRRPERLST